jgi:hypothetical protein
MAIREAENQSMIKLVSVEIAVSHCEKGSCLIREAQRARMQVEPGGWPSQGEIDRTQRMNEAMINLVRLIEEVTAQDECSSS